MGFTLQLGFSFYSMLKIQRFKQYLKSQYRDRNYIKVRFLEAYQK